MVSHFIRFPGSAAGNSKAGLRKPWGQMLAMALGLMLSVTSAQAQTPKKAEPSYDGRSMIYIAGGSFQMGNNSQEKDEAPVHPVLLSPYYIDQYEVTVADFQRFIAATKKEVPKHGAGLIPLLNQVPLFYQESGMHYVFNGQRAITTGEFREMLKSFKYSPSHWVEGNPDGEPAHLSKKDAKFILSIYPSYRMEEVGEVWLFNVNPNYPMFSVTWDQALEYCRYYGKRLPTEAEWEYAARGGQTEGEYPWGNEDPKGHAIFSGDVNRTRPEEVGTVPPNGYQLYDMSGNIWEWVADWYSNTFYLESTQPGQQIVDPYSNIKTGEKVIRGGSWRSEASDLRVTNRNWLAPDKQRLEVGFRCAVSSN